MPFVTGSRAGAGEAAENRHGPRCTVCRAPIAHTPGKRPKVYCSDACRKRGKRAVEAAEREARNGEPSGKSGRLGTRTTEFPTDTNPQVSGEGPKSRDSKESAWRSRRYAGRRALWKVTNDITCRGCGRAAMDPDAGAIYVRTTEGRGVVLGLVKCGKIWLCPVCSAKIRHKRSEEMVSAVVEWTRRGGLVLLVTLTARHAFADQLAALMDAIQGTRADADHGIKRQPGAYQRLITGGTWAGRPERGIEGIRDRVGYIGMTRATEVTLSEANGWHPHIHALVFVGGRTEGERADKRVTSTFTPSESALAELEDHYRAVWTRHLRKLNPKWEPSLDCEVRNCKCGGKGHAVDVKPIHTVREAERYGEYVAKTQDGKNPAHEVARGDMKAGRRGSMTPFQLLGRIGDLLGGMDPDDADGFGNLEWSLGRWSEYEAATKGRRAIEWTRYLRPLLGIEGDDSEEGDLDALFELDGATAEFAEGVAVATDAVHKLAGRALDLAVLEAVESGAGAEGVAELVTAAGGRAAEVRLLTSGEVQEAYASMLASLAERRERAAARRAVERAADSRA